MHPYDIIWINWFVYHIVAVHIAGLAVADKMLTIFRAYTAILKLPGIDVL